MFIPQQFETMNYNRAFIVVYLVPQVAQTHNTASLCIWIVPGSHQED